MTFLHLRRKKKTSEKFRKEDSKTRMLEKKPESCGMEDGRRETEVKSELSQRQASTHPTGNL